MGSVTHFGLAENGQCVDRDGNGVIDTSTGLGDIKDWTNAGGADTLGGVSTAADECILQYVRVNSNGTRHVAVDANNDVWVSGIGGRYFDLIDSATGLIVRQEGSVGYGGYGGLIDGNGVIWSTGSGHLLRWDTALPLLGPNGDPGGLDIGPPVDGTWAGQGHAYEYGSLQWSDHALPARREIRGAIPPGKLQCPRLRRGQQGTRMGRPLTLGEYGWASG
jgi:hypothetical protein